MTRNQAHPSTLLSVSTSREERRGSQGAQLWASRPVATAPGNVELEDPTLLYVPPSARRAIGGSARSGVDVDDTSPSHNARLEDVSRVRHASAADSRITPKHLAAGIAAALALGFTLALLDLRPAEKPAPRANVARARAAQVATPEPRNAQAPARKGEAARAAAATTRPEPPAAPAAVEPEEQSRDLEAPAPAEQAARAPEKLAKAARLRPAPAKVASSRAKTSSEPALRADRQALRPLPASCNPPYYYDRKYIKRIKLECL
jgi:hypothetical protein